MTAYIEALASWLLQRSRGHDDKAFVAGPAFAAHREATLGVRSPDCGAAGATLGAAYMAGGAPGEARVPALAWDGVDGVAEWLVVAEDPDAPLPTPICHGLYLGIPPGKTSFSNADFEPERPDGTRLKGGFHYGMSRRGTVYIPPRPLLNHGIHRYTFDVIALSEPLDASLVASKPTRERVAAAIEGKVLAWGRWMGQCERRWE